MSAFHPLRTLEGDPFSANPPFDLGRAQALIQLRLDVPATEMDMDFDVPETLGDQLSTKFPQS